MRFVRKIHTLDSVIGNFEIIYLNMFFVISLETWLLKTKGPNVSID